MTLKIAQVIENHVVR